METGKVVLSAKKQEDRNPTARDQAFRNNRFQSSKQE
jgi:hypothetical protein